MAIKNVNFVLVLDGETKMDKIIDCDKFGTLKRYDYEQEFKGKIAKDNYVSDLLEKIVKKLGGKIDISEYAHPLDEIKGSLIIEKDSFTIYLNPIKTPISDHFQIAHELGHYFLHKEKQSSFSRYGYDAIDKQADMFAFGFLMPKQEFIRYAKKAKNNLDIAAHFEVPLKKVAERQKHI